MKIDRKKFFARACAMLGLPFLACAGKRVPDVPNCPPPPPERNSKGPRGTLEHPVWYYGSALVEIYGETVLVYYEDRKELGSWEHALPNIPFVTGCKCANGMIAVAYPPLDDETHCMNGPAWCYGLVDHMTGECPPKYRALLDAAVEQTNLQFGFGKYERQDELTSWEAMAANWGSRGGDDA